MSAAVAKVIYSPRFDAPASMPRVSTTSELVERARQCGAHVAHRDALTFIQGEGHRLDTFPMMDFVEHVSFETVAGILEALPDGSSCFIQTPNTSSIIGHQFLFAGSESRDPRCRR